MKFLLVGTAFTPGASAVIAKGLGQRAQVALVAEPENPYDAQAVRVFVTRDEVHESPELTEALAAFGLSVETIQWPLQLGHLGAKAETKAAKAAIAGGHHFELCMKWHGVRAQPGSAEWGAFGRLIQHSNSTNIIEVVGTTLSEGDPK